MINTNLRTVVTAEEEKMAGLQRGLNGTFKPMVLLFLNPVACFLIVFQILNAFYTFSFLIHRNTINSKSSRKKMTEFALMLICYIVLFICFGE